MKTAVNLVDVFLQRAQLSAPSTLTLAGTGPNGSSQLHVLRKIGRDKMRTLSQVNVISGSSVSYFIFIALSEGGFNAEGFRDYDKLVRKLHQGSTLRLLSHLLTRKRKSTPFFRNELLDETLAIFLEKTFMLRTLRSFDDNVSFYAYCLAKKEVVELSAQSQPDMTVKDVFRACVSIPFLHGPFSYKGYRFIDPTFSDSFALLRRQLFSTTNNHLYVNIKKEGQSRNILFIRNEKLKFPVSNMFADFLMLCIGVPNRRVTRTHAAHLKGFEPGTTIPAETIETTSATGIPQAKRELSLEARSSIDASSSSRNRE